MSFGSQTPRQKMINLMYIVLMALLALNVSSDVLRGFTLVDESLTRSTSNSAEQNRSLYNSLAEYMEKNPEKVGPWYEKAMHVKRISDSLYVFVGDLKAKINESNQEDLEAASYVMFSPRTGKGKELALGISQYKNEILELIEDPVQKKIISDNLTLNIPRLFEGTPVAAAVTLLTELQSDVRYAEGEVLHTLTKDIDVHDVVYENAQARERTQILMDIANQTWGMVIGTGDLSELALGWATYNGDHMSMYGVNGSVPKTLVKYLVKWVAENDMDEASRMTLLDIVDTPISPELIPADENGNIKQITEDLVGPYELHDFFLYYFLRCGFRPSKIFFLAVRTFKDVYDEETIKKWLQTFFRRFFNQQFKRSCLPDGPKVGSISISPRGDWRMPSDASSEMWLREVESLT